MARLILKQSNGKDWCLDTKYVRWKLLSKSYNGMLIRVNLPSGNVITSKITKESYKQLVNSEN